MCRLKLACLACFFVYVTYVRVRSALRDRGLPTATDDYRPTSEAQRSQCSAHPAQPTCHCQAAPALPATASLLMRACEYVYCVVMLWWREVQMAATARQILGSEELGCRQWGGQSTTALAFSQARGLCIPLHHP